jgi:hypothetical protein
MWECLRRATVARAWPVRWLWRRRHRRAADVRAGRVRARMGRGTGRCARCGAAPSHVHVAYRDGGTERLGHFCRTCSAQEPPGWLVVVEDGH